jgi:hypothetical protein
MRQLEGGEAFKTKLETLRYSYRALPMIKSRNIQSNKIQSIVLRYSILQYLVDQRYTFRPHGVIFRDLF